jgi:ABC-type proline/glycine betaine transport system substrate-binding protein
VGAGAPAGNDFDPYVYKWVNNTWTLMAKAENDGTQETIKYNGTAGYYTWVVQSYSGAGCYSFYLKKP